MNEIRVGPQTTPPTCENTNSGNMLEKFYKNRRYIGLSEVGGLGGGL